MLEYGFYNSMNGDRRYNSVQMSEIFEGLITDGVYPSVGEMFAVTAGEGMQVIIGTGRAWFDATWSRNKARYPMDIEIADPVFERIDTVCIKVDKSDAVRANSFVVVKGLVSTEPTPSTLPNGNDAFYHPIAYIRVKAAATSLNATDIEILVGKSICPFTTSILQQTNIDTLFANWTQQFMNWWDGIKNILDDDAVGKLINELEKKVNISDKATYDDVIAGTNNEKWVTPFLIKQFKEDGIYEVGDIVATTTPINPENEKWHICDGSYVNKTYEYFNKASRNGQFKYSYSEASRPWVWGNSAGVYYCVFSTINDNGSPVTQYTPAPAYIKVDGANAEYPSGRTAVYRTKFPNGDVNYIKVKVDGSDNTVIINIAKQDAKTINLPAYFIKFAGQYTDEQTFTTYITLMVSPTKYNFMVTNTAVTNCYAVVIKIVNNSLTSSSVTQTALTGTTMDIRYMPFVLGRYLYVRQLGRRLDLTKSSLEYETFLSEYIETFLDKGSSAANGRRFTKTSTNGKHIVRLIDNASLICLSLLDDGTFFNRYIQVNLDSYINVKLQDFDITDEGDIYVSTIENTINGSFDVVPMVDARGSSGTSGGSTVGWYSLLCATDIKVGVAIRYYSFEHREQKQPPNSQYSSGVIIYKKSIDVNGGKSSIPGILAGSGQLGYETLVYPHPQLPTSSYNPPSNIDVNVTANGQGSVVVGFKGSSGRQAKGAIARLISVPNNSATGSVQTSTTSLGSLTNYLLSVLSFTHNSLPVYPDMVSISNGVHYYIRINK